MQYAKVSLKKGKEESLKRRHPWVFSGAIESIDRKVEEGDTVEVFNSEGQYLATGHCQIGSIAVRILTFDREEINADFWERRIETACRLRQALGIINEQNNIFRLIHGEGDNLSGLIVDVYGNTAVVQAHSAGMHLARYEIANAILKTLGKLIKNIYYKSEDTLPYKADLAPEDGYIAGSETNDNTATENNLKFHIDWQRGQKTGFFTDQRDNRLLLQQFARNRKILNMFCYTGGFSVYALRGGAKEVHSVDSSARAIEIADRNVEINFPQCTAHKSFTEDAFKFLANIEKDAYDLIILDPPAFAKRISAQKNALQGYRKLNAAAIEKIRSGGIIFTFSCSQAVSKEDFRLAVFSAAAQAGRNVKILKQLTQQADHPINIYHPESEYIKGLILYVE